MNEADELIEKVGFVAFSLGVLVGALIVTLLYHFGAVEVHHNFDRVQLPYHHVEPLEDNDG